MDKELPLNERERRQHRIRYYQWVPFLLLFQAILCYIPRIIWRSLNVRSGLDIINLVDAAIKYESVDKFSEREKIMAYIIRNVERYIGARKSRYERLYGRKFCAIHKNGEEVSGYASSKQQLKNYHKAKAKSTVAMFLRKVYLRIRLVFSTICFWTGKRLGNYLVVLYMFVKTLWLTNAVSQLFLLNRFIGNDYHAFGVEIIEMLLSGQEWHELRHFPRVTYCDFKIREIGNQHDWTVQCVLRINLFNEVIYIFMWFWLCMLALFSLVDYITWTFRLLISGDKLRFIKRHLDIYNYNMPSHLQQSKASKDKASLNEQPRTSHSSQEQIYSNNLPSNAKPDFEYIDIEKEKKLMKEFTFSYLKDDGIFAMRIMASSASDLIVTEIISELWKNFKGSYTEPADELTLISSPSSSSSSTSSSSNSSQSSAATSAASSPSSAPANTQLSSKQPSQQQQQPQPSPSPTGFTKKPFNYGQSFQPQPQSSPNQSKPFSMGPNNNGLNAPIYSNSNNNRTATPPIVSSSPIATASAPIPPPPVPQSNMPILTNNNTSSLEEGPFKRPLNNVSNNQSYRENLYPQMQQRHIHHEHSNVNSNAKDTHV
jgi:hypothetical protein